MLAIVIAVVIVYAVRQQGASQKIKIGFIAPLSGDGAAMGEEQKHALDLAVEEINKSGGINGKPLEIIYEDGKCDGKAATTAAQKLLSVDAVKILMPVCTAESMAVAPIARQNKVLEFAVWPTTSKYSGIGEYSFRNSYSDEDTSRVMADTIGAKFSRIGMITELTDYSVSLRDAFKKYFKGQIYEEGYQVGARDMRTQLAKILARNPQAILVNPNFPSAGITILEEARNLGYKGPFYGNWFGGSGDVLKASAAQGMIFFADPRVPDNPMQARFFAEYEKRFGKPNFVFAVAAQYDSAYILKQAIEAVGLNPDKLKDYLHSLKDFRGVLGTYGFNDKGDTVGYSPAVEQIKNGEAVPYNGN